MNNGFTTDSCGHDLNVMITAVSSYGSARMWRVYLDKKVNCSTKKKGAAKFKKKKLTSGVD